MYCFYCGAPDHAVGKEPNIKCPWKKFRVPKDEAIRQEQARAPRPGTPGSAYQEPAGETPQGPRAPSTASTQGTPGSAFHERRLRDLLEQVVEAARQYARALGQELASQQLMAMFAASSAQFAAQTAMTPAVRQRQEEEEEGE